MALTVEELFVEYRSYVATVAMRILGDPQGADDVVQETFISAHKHLKQLRDPGAAKGWLARIAVRHAQATLRRRKLKRFVGLDSVPDYFAIAPEASPRIGRCSRPSTPISRPCQPISASPGRCATSKVKSSRTSPGWPGARWQRRNGASLRHRSRSAQLWRAVVTDELQRRLSTLSPNVRREIDDEKGQRMWGRIGQIRKRRRNTRIAVGSVATLLVLVAAGWLATSLLTNPPNNPAVALHDVDVQPLGESCRVDVVATSDSRVELAVRSGAARFDVVPSRTRTVEVKAGVVRVLVVGTVFVVDRRNDGVIVTVQRGVVQVEHPGGRTELTADSDNARGYFSFAGRSRLPTVDDDEAAPGDDARPAESDDETASDETSKVVERKPKPKRNGWRPLARAGKYKEAFAELDKTPDDVRDRPNELLLAADVARLSGHPGKAVPYLDKVIKRYPKDPRAPSAAFTLGRVQLYSLGQAGQAAKSFNTARILAPNGPLAADALAREAESWQRAGNTARGKTLARDYLRPLP